MTTQRHHPTIPTRARSAAFGAAFTLALAGAALAADEEPAFAQRAAKAVAKLAESLGTRLQEALQTGGPANAVAVCRSVAGPITDAVNRDLEGLRVRRTSLKTRNPANAPDATDRKVLARLARQWEEEDHPKPDGFIEGEGNDARFYKPIVMQAVCLNCHGPKDAIDPGVAALLDELYPDDRATGYREGELRGVFRVEPAEPDAAADSDDDDDDEEEEEEEEEGKTESGAGTAPRS